MGINKMFLRVFLLLVMSIKVNNSVGQMIAVHGMVAKPVTGSVAAPLQTVWISFNKFRQTLPSGWYTWWDSEDSAVNLKNSASASTGWNLVDISGGWAQEQQSSTHVDNEFPAAALEWMVYSTNQDKNIRLINLASTGKRYELIFSCVKTYDGADDETDITVNGVTKKGTLGVANAIYKTIFSVSNPSSGIIDIQFHPANYGNGDAYACVNALIIKEYAL